MWIIVSKGPSFAIAWTEAREETSTCRGETLYPSPRRVAVAASGLRSPKMMRRPEPRRRAMARPMPPEPIIASSRCDIVFYLIL